MTLAHPFSGKWKKLLNTAVGGALLLTGCTAADSAPNSASTKAAATTNDNSDPALWVVKDHDTTIYMFGTVHLLKPGLSWFDEAVKDAFDKSDTLVMEIADVTDPEAMKAMEPLVKKYAADANGKKLRDKLTAEQRSIFDAEMTKVRVDRPVDGPLWQGRDEPRKRRGKGAGGGGQGFGQEDGIA